jgi:hypothetical protein
MLYGTCIIFRYFWSCMLKFYLSFFKNFKISKIHGAMLNPAFRNRKSKIKPLKQKLDLTRL